MPSLNGLYAESAAHYTEGVHVEYPGEKEDRVALCEPTGPWHQILQAVSNYGGNCPARSNYGSDQLRDGRKRENRG